MPPAVPPRRRWIRIAGGICAICLLLILTVLGWLYFAITSVPDYYAEILVNETPEVTQPLSQQAEDAVRTTSKALREKETWQLVLHEEEVNAWLKHELPKEYGKKLPSELQNPRIHFQKDEILLAVTYTGTLETVLSLAIVPRLNTEKRELQVEIMAASIGDLPVPLHRLLPTLHGESTVARLPIAWESTAEALLGRLKMPFRLRSLPERDLEITAFQVSAGQLVIEGTSTPVVKGK
jgi:hypothetical protein